MLLPLLPILMWTPHYSWEVPLKPRSKPSRPLRLWPLLTCLASFLPLSPGTLSSSHINYFQFSRPQHAMFFHAFTPLLKFSFSQSSPRWLLLSSQTSAQRSPPLRTEVFPAWIISPESFHSKFYLYWCRLYAVLYIIHVYVSAEQLYHKPFPDRDMSNLYIPNPSNLHMVSTQ